MPTSSYLAAHTWLLAARRWPCVESLFGLMHLSRTPRGGWEPLTACAQVEKVSASLLRGLRFFVHSEFSVFDACGSISWLSSTTT